MIKAIENMRACIAILLGLVLMSGCSHKQENMKSPLLVQEQANALEAKILLTDLRAGRTTNAIELLEVKMDSAIIGINSRLSTASATERSQAEATLRAIKAYREAHPRHVEAVLPDTQELLQETTRMREEASNILSSIK